MPNVRAEREARALLERFRVTTAPVPVDVITRQLGVDLRFEALDTHVSGVLVRRGDETVIGVNARHHPNRQRFTIAHELGHFMLHPDAPTVLVDDAFVHFRGDDITAPTDSRELEANVFAACLLMPEVMLRADLRGQYIDAFDEGAVRALARRYGVSQQALTIRLVRLGLTGGVRPL